MIEYFVLAITILVFMIASYEDIKKREVYDYLNFGYFFIILIAAAIYSFSQGTPEHIFYSIFGGIVGFLFGSIFYYLGFWGGGDAKFLLGFGSSIPFISSFSSTFLDIFHYLNSGISNLVLNLEIFNLISNIIFIINIILIFLVAIRLIFKKTKQEIIDIICLFFSLSFLTAANFMSVNTNYLIALGTISFILILFSDDRVFKTIYFNIKSKPSSIKEGDSIEINSKKVIENISRGKINTLKNKDNISKRVYLPYFLIVMINLIIFCIKVIFSNSINLETFFYLITFIFISFLIGGIIAILILFYTYLKNFKKIKIKIPYLYKLSSLISSILFFISILYFESLSLLFLILAILPYFITIAKEAEKFMFVSQKNISKLVPGDWVVEDFVVKNKVIFSKEDFKLGINEEQIKEIDKLSKKNKIDKILVKDGLAFLPPMFIAFLIILFI